MRGLSDPQSDLFSYVSLENRVPADHPLRRFRQLVDVVLSSMDDELSALYSGVGRPSIPPEHLLRAALLQVLYTIRSERMLVEQMDYNLLFRWFVGLSMDDRVWDHSTFLSFPRSCVAPLARHAIPFPRWSVGTISQTS